MSRCVKGRKEKVFPSLSLPFLTPLFVGFIRTASGTEAGMLGTGRHPRLARAGLWVPCGLGSSARAGVPLAGAPRSANPAESSATPLTPVVCAGAPRVIFLCVCLSSQVLRGGKGELCGCGPASGSALGGWGCSI